MPRHDLAVAGRVGLAEARRALAAAVPETDFQRTVTEMAERFGWLVYHTYDSRRSAPGFPDLVLVRPPRVLFAELKSEHGRVTTPQEAWLKALGACDGVEAHLWRPSDSAGIEGVLR